MMKQKKRYPEFLFFSAAILCVLVVAGFHHRTEGFHTDGSPVIQDTLFVLPIDTVPVILPLDTLQLNLSFVIDSLTDIQDPTGSLDRFYEELEMLKEGKDTVITIVHLGDSHIQAGFLSGQFMRLMHGQYGNAGRGWIAPFKLSKTNEPDDYFISSVVKDWTAGRATQNNRKTPIGVGGLGVQSVSPFVNFDLIITPKNGAGYKFNEVILYRGDRSMPMLPSGKIKDSVEICSAHSSILPGLLADTFRISFLTDTFQLQSTRRKPGTDSLLPDSHFTNLYYGFSLRNGNPGILYHSIGLNGAMYVNYTDSQYVKQLALLQPSLLIISLGTNETFGRRFTKKEFAGQAEIFISLVKQYMPGTAILLTTPPECYKRVTVNKQRTYIRNAQTELAAEALVQVALENDVACWDLFACTGGKESNKHWFNGKWMGKDRIHFNKEGYREQGKLLFKALHSKNDCKDKQMLTKNGVDR